MRFVDKPTIIHESRLPKEVVNRIKANEKAKELERLKRESAIVMNEEKPWPFKHRGCWTEENW